MTLLISQYNPDDLKQIIFITNFLKLNNPVCKNQKEKIRMPVENNCAGELADLKYSWINLEHKKRLPISATPDALIIIAQGESALFFKVLFHITAKHQQKYIDENKKE